ncbi:Alkanesulfonate monooxygenase [Baekduia alba]|uniref:LLM class flavin-dependent oxidoreductase n=1 Tax=Baekduia alba TaxID=2997333 RepID=UPI002341C70A|nr:LLM class flavin-dependent oxidoreductase [Baekduia alba]WCB93132.1 Alkanesulfonate monooxygenase [Baekduia alba]
MRFSIFYEHQVPRPWEADGEHRLLQEALEQVELADRLGFDTVWAAEHHFLEEHSHSSAPGVFLAAASQRTTTIRLGFGTVPLAPGYQHPARVAEAAATLDLLSDGRVELGTGETSSGAELAGFGVDRETQTAQWSEAIEIVARMMVETPFAGADTDHIKMPPRNVVPKPLQKPHPPLWVACPRQETIRRAAEKGLGALSFAFVEPEDVRSWVDEYYTIISSDRCVPAGFAVNPNFAAALPMMVHADEAEAIERGIDGAHFLGYALGHYNAFGEHAPGRTSIWEEFQARRDDVGFARSAISADGAPLSVKVLQRGLGSVRGAIGTPAQLRELIGRYEDAGVDELLFCLQTGKTQHKHIMEALELFAAEVMPAFAQRRPARARDKAERLGDAAERALERRAPRRTVARGYAFKAGDSGVDAAAVAIPEEPAAPSARRAPGAAVTSLRRQLETHGERAFQAFVGRSDDARLARTAGSGAGLRVIFGAMERQFVPERAAGFTGDIQYNLRAVDGSVRAWTVAIDRERARARPGAADDAELTITLAVADFIRIAGRDLDPVKAVLTGRMELAGDFGVALKLGEMFGQPGGF